MTVGFVYAIQSLDLIKVGVAKNIEKRMNDMRLENPHGCKLIFQRRSTAPYTLEKQMHKRLADKAVGREWFRATLADIRAAAYTARLETLRKERALTARVRLAVAKNPELLTRRVNFSEVRSIEINGLDGNC